MEAVTHNTDRKLTNLYENGPEIKQRHVEMYILYKMMIIFLLELKLPLSVY